MTLEELENSCIELPCKECILKCKCNMILHKKFESSPGKIIYHIRSICSIVDSYDFKYCSCSVVDVNINIMKMSYTICKEFGLEFIKWLEINANWNNRTRDMLQLYKNIIEIKD